MKKKPFSHFLAPIGFRLCVDRTQPNWNKNEPSRVVFDCQFLFRLKKRKLETNWFLVKKKKVRSKLLFCGGRLKEIIYMRMVVNESIGRNWNEKKEDGSINR